MDRDDEWSKYQYFVLQELERRHEADTYLNEKLEKMGEAILARVGRLERRVEMLVVQSGVWGALSGMIAVSVTLMMVFIKYYLDK